MKQKPFETFENRVAQFKKDEQLRKDTEALRTKHNAKTTVKAADTENPYLRARVEILTNYPKWRREEVLEMEQNGSINNPHYNAFVKEVADLGDKYMPII